MKKTIPLLIVALLLAASAHPQSFATNKLSGDPRQDLPLLLTPGVHAVNIIGVNLNKLTDSSGPEPIITGKDTVEIIRDGKNITFRGRNRFKSIDSLSIDLGSNMVLFRQYLLTYSGMKEKAGTASPAMAGDMYGYTFEEQGNTDLATATDLRNISFTQMQFIVGRISTTGKTIFLLMASKFVKGRPIMNVVIPFLFE